MKCRRGSGQSKVTGCTPGVYDVVSAVGARDSRAATTSVCAAAPAMSRREQDPLAFPMTIAQAREADSAAPVASAPPARADDSGHAGRSSCTSSDSSSSSSSGASPRGGVDGACVTPGSASDAGHTSCHSCRSRFRNANPDRRCSSPPFSSWRVAADVRHAQFLDAGGSSDRSGGNESTGRADTSGIHAGTRGRVRDATIAAPAPAAPAPAPHTTTSAPVATAPAAPAPAATTTGGSAVPSKSDARAATRWRT